MIRNIIVRAIRKFIKAVGIFRNTVYGGLKLEKIAVVRSVQPVSGGGGLRQRTIVSYLRVAGGGTSHSGTVVDDKWPRLWPVVIGSYDLYHR